jgi:hypothetical protein
MCNRLCVASLRVKGDYPSAANQGARKCSCYGISPRKRPCPFPGRGWEMGARRTAGSSTACLWRSSIRGMTAHLGRGQRSRWRWWPSPGTWPGLSALTGGLGPRRCICADALTHDHASAS